MFIYVSLSVQVDERTGIRRRYNYVTKRSETNCVSTNQEPVIYFHKYVHTETDHPTDCNDEEFCVWIHNDYHEGE